jgi:catechol 2,3-dioxygenase-like lactoylglutathione lyase family enzyme
MLYSLSYGRAVRASLAKEFRMTRSSKTPSNTRMPRRRVATALQAFCALPVLLVPLAARAPTALAADPPAAAPRATVAPATAAAEASRPVQSLLLRAVTVTYDLERSLLFYRDILGQELMELNRLDTARSQRYLDIGPRAEVWFASLRGRGEYAGGAVTGGRIAFLGIRDPDARPEDKRPATGRRGRQGDAVLPHRVSNLDEIMARLARNGFEVLVPPTVSSSGLSRSAMVFDPNGKIVELFELFAPPPTPPLSGSAMAAPTAAAPAAPSPAALSTGTRSATDARPTN